MEVDIDVNIVKCHVWSMSKRGILNRMRNNRKGEWILKHK